MRLRRLISFVGILDKQGVQESNEAVTNINVAPGGLRIAHLVLLQRVLDLSIAEIVISQIIKSLNPAKSKQQVRMLSYVRGVFDRWYHPQEVKASTRRL